MGQRQPNVDKGLVEPDPVTHPTVPVKIPGVDLAREQCGGSPVTVVEDISKEEGHNALANNSLRDDKHVDRTGVFTAIDILAVDDDNVVDLGDRDDVPATGNPGWGTKN